MPTNDGRDSAARSAMSSPEAERSMTSTQGYETHGRKHQRGCGVPQRADGLSWSSSFVFCFFMGKVINSCA